MSKESSRLEKFAEFTFCFGLAQSSDQNERRRLNPIEEGLDRGVGNIGCSDSGASPQRCLLHEVAERWVVDWPSGFVWIHDSQHGARIGTMQGILNVGLRLSTTMV